MPGLQSILGRSSELEWKIFLFLTGESDAGERNEKSFLNQDLANMLHYFPLTRIYADPHKNENSKVKLLSLCWIEGGDVVQSTVVLIWCTLYEILNNVT